jgi:hypothetical protein
MGDYRLQMTTFHRTRVVTRRSAARIIAAIKAAHIVIPGSFLEHPLCWPAFQRLVVCLPFSGRHHTHITGHAIHGAPIFMPRNLLKPSKTTVPSFNSVIGSWSSKR